MMTLYFFYQHFTALYKLQVSSIEEKKYERDMFEEARFEADVQEVTYEGLSHEWTYTVNLYCT